jgi:release factor glutamine methyltransferase
MRSEAGLSRRALLTEAAGVLEAAGIGAPRREARRLWADLMGDPPDHLVLHPEEPVSAERGSAYCTAVKRRAAGEPLAYVTGWTGFRHLILRCDPRALIPRPETEGLVDLVLARVRTGRIADVGTGTGCLALSLAAEGGYAEVLAVDLSASALELAGENARGVDARVSLVRGDCCASLRQASLDALVSNPPYLSAGEYASLDPSVRSWEPALALVGGASGPEITARLLDQGRVVLRRGGWLALEIDCTRAVECAALAGALGWSEVALHADLFGRERYLLARRSDAP